MLVIEPHDLIGRQVGKYRFIERIGRGGMAFVYRGEHVDIGQPIAIKVLFQKHSQSPEKRARFHREAQLQFRLRHINLVRSFDLIDEQGILGIVMDWVDGLDLATYTEQKGGRLDLEELRSLFLPVLEVVHYAHRQGIIHRDLKPTNILLERREERLVSKVLDFGIAKLLNDTEWQTEEGVLLGTPAYLAPEQAERGKLDHRVDIYALGITFYQLATGQLPFSGETILEVLLAHRDKTPPPMRFWDPTIPPSIDYIIQTALAKHPNERFESCEVFADALNAAYANTHYPFVSPDARAAETLGSTKTEVSLSPHNPSLNTPPSAAPDPTLFPRLAALAKHHTPAAEIPPQQHPDALSTTWAHMGATNVLLPTGEAPPLHPPKSLKNTFTQITQISLASFSNPTTNAQTSTNPQPTTEAPSSPAFPHQIFPTPPATPKPPSHGNLPKLPQSPSYGSLSTTPPATPKLSAPPLSSRMISPTDPTDVSPSTDSVTPLSQVLHLLDPNDQIDSMILRLSSASSSDAPPTTPLPPARLSPPPVRNVVHPHIAALPVTLDLFPEENTTPHISLENEKESPFLATHLPSIPSEASQKSATSEASQKSATSEASQKSATSESSQESATSESSQESAPSETEGFAFRTALFFGLLIGFILFLMIRFLP